MAMVPVINLELNHIVYHYLQESGFVHTAFNFHHEAAINEYPFHGYLFPCGALVRLTHKGLKYIAMEANDSNFGKSEVDKQQYLKPMDLITKDVHELQKIVADRKKQKGQKRVRFKF